MKGQEVEKSKKVNGKGKTDAKGDSGGNFWHDTFILYEHKTKSTHLGCCFFQ